MLNRPEYAAGSVLVAGPDFGTGSSREHAVWALQNYGFKAVISPRFGDIFRGNSGKAGLLAAQVDEKVVQRLWDHLEDNPGATVTVDLESRTVRAGDGVDAIEDSFDIDDYTRWRLLEGLDDIGITLGHDDDIAAYEATRPSWKPATQRWRDAARTGRRQNSCAPTLLVADVVSGPLHISLACVEESRARARPSVIRKGSS